MGPLITLLIRLLLLLRLEGLNVTDTRTELITMTGEYDTDPIIEKTQYHILCADFSRKLPVKNHDLHVFYLC